MLLDQFQRFLVMSLIALRLADIVQQSRRIQTRARVTLRAIAGRRRIRCPRPE